MIWTPCRLIGMALFCLVPCGIIAFSQLAQAQDTQPPAAAPAAPASAPTSPPALTDASTATREGRLLDARRLLQSVDHTTLSESDTARWLNLASRTALRLGDKDWLKQINQRGDLDENGDTLLILGAMRFLLAGKYDNARKALAGVDQPERLSEIPRRRYLELWARLHQLDGQRHDERAYVTKLVDFAATWPSKNCQSCHANPKKYGDEVTTVDMQNWWVGDRFTALLKADGDAVKVRDAAAARLKTDPADASARLRLVYALRALDDRAASTAELRSIPWTQWPDRERTPLRVGVFP